MITSQANGAIMSAFSFPDLSESSSSDSVLFSLSSSSSSFAPPHHKQMYTRNGYHTVYGIAIGSQVLCLITLLLINTGRGRKAQAAYEEELLEQKKEQERLLRETESGDEEIRSVTSSFGSINADTSKFPK